MTDQNPRAPQILRPEDDDDFDPPPLCVPYAGTG